MKNSIFRLSMLLFVVTGIFSCDIEPLDNGVEPINPIVNNGSFSVNFNNSTYSTNEVSAIAMEGAITLTAQSNTGIFLFLILGDEEGTYSHSQLNMSYTNNLAQLYSNFALDNGNSTLTITSINYQQNTISGTFGFTGVRLSETGEPTTETITFTQGTFTNIPVTGLVNPNPVETECEQATSEAETAKNNYENASEENLVEACNNYRSALENKIVACGDLDGTIQAIIDGLDCTENDIPENSAGIISVTVGSMPTIFDVVTVTQEGTLLKIYGEYSHENFDRNIYFEVELGETGEDIFQNFEMFMPPTTLYPYNEGMYPFRNNVIVNSGGQLSGTFGGYTMTGNGGVVDLTQGTFELEF